jgi:hypothetical protein
MIWARLYLCWQTCCPSRPATTIPPLNRTPQKRKERTLHAQLAQVEGLSTRQPVLTVFEDVHWSDPTTRESLDLVWSKYPSGAFQPLTGNTEPMIDETSGPFRLLSGRGDAPIGYGAGTVSARRTGVGGMEGGLELFAPF